jgi:hypothetical protein
LTIQILPDGEYIALSKDEPIVGRIYALDDVATGTAAQRRTFHALVTCYYNSGMWSYPGSGYKQGATWSEFRDIIKQKLGAGFEMYFYATVEDGKPVARKVKTLEEIPEEIRTSPRRKEMIFGRLKSWTDYSKRERSRTIDSVKNEMLQVGVNTKAFQEILEGMEKGER